MALEVLIVSTGVANTASVIAGLRRAGAEPRLTRDPDAVANAPRVVLPGVGAFAAGMDQLDAEGLSEPLRARIEAGRPTLAVCLGLQLLCRHSEESPGRQGLGIIDAHVRRFPDTVRVPQMGWNEVTPQSDCALLEPGHAYFANSYRLSEIPPGWRGALTQHAGPCVAAMERGAVLACQFHPELSGHWGTALMRRWLSLDDPKEG